MLGNFFNSDPKKAAVSKAKYETVVVPPDFRLAAGFVAGGAALCLAANNYAAGVPIGLIGAFLALQTTRVRFEFDADSLEVKILKKDGDAETLADSGDNFAVGGANRWKYDTFTNWEMYPSPSLPILVYFKETQTIPEGQIHFFPVIMNGRKLYEIMEERCPRLPRD